MRSCPDNFETFADAILPSLRPNNPIHFIIPDIVVMVQSVGLTLISTFFKLGFQLDFPFSDGDFFLIFSFICAWMSISCFMTTMFCSSRVSLFRVRSSFRCFRSILFLVKASLFPRGRVAFL